METKVDDSPASDPDILLTEDAALYDELEYKLDDKLN
jgi:hypothetical protein